MTLTSICICIDIDLVPKRFVARDIKYKLNNNMFEVSRVKVCMARVKFMFFVYLIRLLVELIRLVVMKKMISFRCNEST